MSDDAVEVFGADDTKLFWGDAMQVLEEQIPDGSVDLVFADPPYNIGKRFGEFHDRWPSDEAYAEWCQSRASFGNLYALYECKQKFPQAGVEPIVRDDRNGLYWFNERLLIVDLGTKKVNIAKAVIKIIDAYAAAKRSALESFILDCEKLKGLKVGAGKSSGGVHSGVARAECGRAHFRDRQLRNFEAALRPPVDLLGLDI